MSSLDLAVSIRTLAAQVDADRPFVVAIDGRSGVGKSTFARDLAERLGAALVEGDDFFAGGWPSATTARENAPPRALTGGASGRC